MPKPPGRPRELRSPQLMTVRLPGSLIKRVDAFVRRRKARSRSEAVRHLLATALDEAAAQDRSNP